MEIVHELSDPRAVAVVDVKGDGRVTSACVRMRDSAAVDDGSLTATLVRNAPWASFIKDAKERATLPPHLAQRVQEHMRSVEARSASSTASRIRVRPDARRRDEAAEFAGLVQEIAEYATERGLSAAEVVAAAFSSDAITTDYVTASQWVREASLQLAGLGLRRSARRPKTVR